MASNSFDPSAGKKASRVKSVEVRLIISEDDYLEVPAVAAVAAVAEVLDVDGIVVSPAIPAVTAVTAIPAHTETMYNGDYRFDILDQNGDVMERRSGEITPHLTSARKGQVKGLLDFVMGKAKSTIV